jgi:hypothetical protein
VTWRNLRARDTSTRALRTLALAITVTAAGLSGCGDDGDSDTATFERDGFPFTFEYPDTFVERSDEPEFGQELGAAADDAVAITIDEANGLILQRFTLNIEIDETNLDLATQELDTLLQQVDPDAEGEPGEIAGFTSLTYEQVDLGAPEGGESSYIVLFEGDQEYLINCQSTPEYRDEVREACDQAIETLTPR